MAKHKSYDLVPLRERINNAFSYRIVPAHTSEGHFYQREDTGKVAASVTTKLAFVSKGYLHKWYSKMAVEHVRANLERLVHGDLSVLDEAQHAGERSRDDSAGIGTTAHGAVDAYNTEWIKSGSRPASAVNFLAEGSRGEEIAACRSFDKFISENEVLPVASEIQIWYEKWKDCYAGTVDSIFLFREVYKERCGKEGCKAIANIGAHDYERQTNGILWCIECNREVTEKFILGDIKTSNTIKGKSEYAHQTEAYARAIETAVGIKFEAVWILRLEKSKADYEILKVGNRKQAWKEWLAISRAYDLSRERGEEELLVPLVERDVITI